MPCYATGSAEGDALLQRDEAHKLAPAAARAACELAKAVPLSSKETRAWVSDHALIDEKKKRAKR
jgi:hypothetical protein